MIKPPTVQAHDAVWRLDMTMDVNGLVEIKHSVVPPAQRVQNVMCILRTETGKHNATRVGFAAVMLVGKVQQLGALRGVTTAIAGLDTCRQEQSIRKHRRLVRFAR